MDSQAEPLQALIFVVSVSYINWPVNGLGTSVERAEDVVKVNNDMFEAHFDWSIEPLAIFVDEIAELFIFAAVTALLASLSSVIAEDGILFAPWPTIQEVPSNSQILSPYEYVSPDIGELGKSRGITQSPNC